jgi:hypothetical protein
MNFTTDEKNDSIPNDSMRQYIFNTCDNRFLQEKA